MDRMRITVLVENTSDGVLRSEHGLSLYIEHGGLRYLMDMGKTDAFARNAEHMDISLSAVDHAIISHGHHDHTGGLEAFFLRNERAKVYLQRKAILPHYGGADCHANGMSAEIISRYPGRFEYLDGPFSPAQGVWLIPHTTKGLERIGERMRFCTWEDGAMRPDSFDHEQTAVFAVKEGLVIVSSCTHCGAETVLQEVRQALPGKPIRAFVGGLHLSRPRSADELLYTQDEICALAGRMDAFGAGEFVTGHCTGKRAAQILAGSMKSRCRMMTTGMRLAFCE